MSADMTLYDYVRLGMTLYDYVWLCMTMYGYVWLCMTIFDNVWQSMSMTMKGDSVDNGTAVPWTCKNLELAENKFWNKN